MLHQTIENNSDLGISLALIGRTDICIQTLPIATIKPSRDTSNSL